MPGNLPKPTTTFVGRDAELNTMKSRFGAGQRLITILGPGGAGKTRLASEYARRFDQDYPGGVWFFELTPYTNGEDALEAARAEFNIREKGGSAIKAIAHQIEEDGPALFILDNLEHLAIDFADAVSKFMKLSPNTQIVATSREPLHVIGEYQIRLGPLQAHDAVELFKARAAAHVPNFELDDDGRRSVLELAGRVDYLPLAIELAASRVSLLSPANLVERLTHRMSALKSRERDRPERHQTIAATIEWSWELLPESCQDALLDLSPISGTFTLEDAEELLDGDALELVSGLLDYSMLERVGEDRFRVLGTVRGFAHIRLMETERGRAVLDRHALYFSSKVLDAHHLDANGFRLVLPTLKEAAANPNVSTPVRARCAVAAARVLNNSDGFGAIIRELESIESLPEDARDPDIFAESLLFRAVYAHDQRQLEAGLKLVERARENTQNESLALRTHAMRAMILAADGHLKEAFELLDTALNTQRTSDPRLQLLMRGNLAMIAFSLGDQQRGTELLAETLVQAEALKDHGTRARTLTNLGVAASAQGRDDEARRYFRDAAQILDELGDTKFQAVAIASLADIERHAGNNDAALELYAQGLELARSAKSSSIELRCLAGRASLYLDAQDRGYLVQAMEKVEDESETIDSQVTRSHLFFFDLWFENDPLARHQARLMLDFQTLPDAWKAVIAGLLALSYAVRHDFSAAESNIQRANTFATGEFAPAFVSAAELIARRIQNASSEDYAPALQALQSASSDDLTVWPRFEALRLLREIARRHAPQTSKAVLRITKDGRKFIAPGENEVIDFTRRGALRMILVGLAELRRDQPGVGISLDDVLEMGWPGERVTPEAAASRVYTAIRTLRGFGLDDHLLTTDQGYLFSTELDVSFEEL